MSKTMNRDEARVWLAQNPGREVCLPNAPGGSPDYYRLTADGVLQYRYGNDAWAISTGLIGGTYHIVEPEKPKEDELTVRLSAFWDGPTTSNRERLAAAICAEIARIADERIAKARLLRGNGFGSWTGHPDLRLIPGDE